MALALAEENQTQNGLKGALDWAQNHLAGALPSTQGKPLGRGDIGPANINADTATDLLHSAGQVNDPKAVAKKLLTESGTIEIGALAMKEVERIIRPLITKANPGHVDALLSNGWREGPENLAKRIRENQEKKGDGYRPDPGWASNVLVVKSSQISGILKNCQK